MSQQVLEKILNEKIIAIIRGMSCEVIGNLIKAYSAGGIHCVEVTFNQCSDDNYKETLDAINLISQTEGMVAGAGTVMNVEQVRLAAKAGAQYIISPNVDEDVIKETKKLGMVSIPGAMTPSEIAYAYKMGADIVKLFPTANLGLSYVKNIKAPLSHIRIQATGGVTPENIADYLKAGCVSAGVGGKLVDKKAIAEGDYQKIEEAAKQYVDAIKATLV